MKSDDVPPMRFTTPQPMFPRPTPATCTECGRPARSYSGRPPVIRHQRDCADYRPGPVRTLPATIRPVDDESARNLFASYLTTSGFRPVDDYRADIVYRSRDNKTDVWFDTIDGDDVAIVRWRNPYENNPGDVSEWRVSATYTTPIPHLLTIATTNDRDV